MAEKSKEQVEMAPDPDEDDLDDLDDVLDQFAAKPSSKPTDTAAKSAPSTSGPGRPTGQETPKHVHGQLPSDADLQAQLQSGMKDLMGELDGNPQMQAEFERMMQELIQAGQATTDAEMAEHIGNATSAVAGSDSAIAAAAGTSEAPKKESSKSVKGSSGGAAQQENFQDTIRKTMERMQASSSSATEASHQGSMSSEEDMLAQMMKELGAGGGEGGEEDFNKMLMSMMAQLTNKEILYEPMKELHDKFPAWMENNEGKVGKEDLERYREQQTLVGEIVGRFERKGYSDDDEGDREFIVERMQKMQAAGSPPPDLVGDMSAAQEALGDLEGGCPTQ